MSEGQRYFFDVNNFDGPAVPEPEEDLPPPPPIFSVEELGQAQKVSFEEGRVVGRQEEQQSRAQYIATQVSELNTQILGLILSEQMREKRFEQEVIHLCRALMKRIFPALTAKESYAEIERVITSVLAKQPLSRIKIEVPTDDLEEINGHLAGFRDIDLSRLDISGNTELSKGCCRMIWQDGGAIRDHEALAMAIFAELDEVLAPPPQKVQNSESEPHNTESLPPHDDDNTVKGE